MNSAHKIYAAFCHPSRGDHMPLVGLAIVFVIAPFAIAFGVFADVMVVDTSAPVVRELVVPK